MKNASHKDVKRTAENCIGQISRHFQELNWTDPDVYAAWLSQTYYYVRYTTRFVAFAAGRCRLEEEPLFSKLVQGLTEEKGHDVLATRDLQALGRKISEFRECAETAAYHQTLFRNIDVHGPAAILGYSIPLEGVAAIGIAPALKIIVQTYGQAGSNFLRTHCELDEGHFTEAFGFLENLGTPTLAVVNQHLELSTALYLGILEAVPRLAKETRLQKSPKAA